MRNNQGRGKCYQPRPSARSQYLDYLGYHKKPNLIIVLLYIVLKKITTNTPSQET